MNLSELGLSDDIVQALTAALESKGVEVFVHEKGKKVIIDDNNFVPLSEHKALKQEKKQLEDQLSTVSTELDKLSGEASATEELKGTIADLQGNIETMKTEHEQRLNDLNKRHKVEARLTGHHKAKTVLDKIPAMQYIDMDKISIDGDNVIGLDEQVTPLLEGEDSKTLFGETIVEGTNPPDKGKNQQTTDLDKMTMAEYAEHRGMSGALKTI